MDWTLWFVPLDTDVWPGWVGRLLRGLLRGDEATLSLIDERAFRAAFPGEGSFPPEFVRLTDVVYSLDPAGGSW